MARILAAHLVVWLVAVALRAQPAADVVIAQNELEFHSAFCFGCEIGGIDLSPVPVPDSWPRQS